MKLRAGRRDIHFTADDEFAQLLERGARMAKLSKAGVVREAVVNHVREMERKAMEKDLEEAYEGLSDLNRKLDDEMRSAGADWPDQKGK